MLDGLMEGEVYRAMERRAMDRGKWISVSYNVRRFLLGHYYLLLVALINILT